MVGGIVVCMMAQANFLLSVVPSEQMLFSRIHFNVLTLVLLYHLIVHRRLMITDA